MKRSGESATSSSSGAKRFPSRGTRARARTPIILIYVQACVGMAVTRRTEAKKRCAISPPIAIRHFASTPQIDGVRRGVRSWSVIRFAPTSVRASLRHVRGEAASTGEPKFNAKRNKGDLTETPSVHPVASARPGGRRRIGSQPRRTRIPVGVKPAASIVGANAGRVLRTTQDSKRRKEEGRRAREGDELQ